MPSASRVSTERSGTHSSALAGRLVRRHDDGQVHHAVAVAEQHEGALGRLVRTDPPDGTVDRAEPVARHDEHAGGGVGHLLGEPGVVGPPEAHPVVRVGGEGDVREKAFGAHSVRLAPYLFDNGSHLC